METTILTRLIQQAIESNYDLKIAGERIRAAHDAVRVAAAGGRPEIGIGAAAESRRETQTIDWPPASPRYGEYPYHALGFNASWELDLFGETRRRKESARAAADAAVETRRGILISLTAAVASNYLSFRATELRLQIARENLDIRGHRSAPRYPQCRTRLRAVERQLRGCGGCSVPALFHSFEHRSSQ